MITVPILFPIIEKLGMDPIWFGIICTINMEMANITPPVGLNLFIIRSVAPPEVTLKDIALGSLPFCGLLIIGLIIFISFPELVLWLPNHMMGY